MTKTEKAVSWGLTSFFGVICLAAAPQLSVGFLIKYGMLSAALGFGITAVSNAVGKLFPDNDYTYNASGSRTVHHHHHHNNSNNFEPKPRHHWWLLGQDYSYGTYVDSKVENISTPVSNPNHGTYLGSRVESVQQSATPPLHSNTTGTYIGSRTENVVPSHQPSAPVSSGAFLGSRYEPVTPSYMPSAASHSNSGSGFFAGFTSFRDSSPSTGLNSKATHVGTRYESV